MQKNLMGAGSRRELLGIHLGWGLVGIWIGMGLDECPRAIGTQIRWSRGSWMRCSKSNV